jgi:hypothetical protein
MGRLMFLQKANKFATYCVINIFGILAILHLQLHKIENEPPSVTVDFKFKLLPRMERF